MLCGRYKSKAYKPKICTVSAHKGKCSKDNRNIDKCTLNKKNNNKRNPVVWDSILIMTRRGSNNVHLNLSTVLMD